MHNVCLYFAGCKHSDFIPEFAGCERLPDISNGEVELSGRTVGSTATYSCNQGFVLVGSSTRICQSNGQWSGSEPSCGRSQFFTTGAVNSTMACKYPALLLLLRQICLNSLVDVGCGSLPNPSFGRVDLTGTTVGSTATYTCLPGYTLVGTSTRTCQTNRQWSGVAPVCIRKQLPVMM